MNGAAIVRELQRLSRLLDDALAFAEAQARAFAEANSDYRLAKAKARLGAEEELRQRGHKAPKVGDLEAFVDLATHLHRKEAEEAEGLMFAARESVKARRAQLSALQTIAGLAREEAAFARTGPEGLDS